MHCGGDYHGTESECVPPVCGGVYTNETGILKSPQYPQPYGAHIDCMYEIIAPPGRAIMIEFLDFDLEDTDPRTCSFDVLTVQDDLVWMDNRPIAESHRFCGTTRPPIMVSDFNVMRMRLQSDGSVQSRGFMANYSWVDATCGGVIKTLGHVIQPPLSDTERYAKDSNCSWLIVAPPNQIVQLTFSSFDLEGGRSCVFDHVSVFDGPSESGALIGKFCGTNVPPTERTFGNMMAIQFVSDSSVHGNGFRATYEFLDTQNCEYN